MRTFERQHVGNSWMNFLGEHNKRNCCALGMPFFVISFQAHRLPCNILPTNTLITSERSAGALLKFNCSRDWSIFFHKWIVKGIILASQSIPSINRFMKGSDAKVGMWAWKDITKNGMPKAQQFLDMFPKEIHSAVADMLSLKCTRVLKPRI